MPSVPSLEVVIVTRDRASTLSKVALSSLERQSTLPSRVLVWDASGPSEHAAVVAAVQRLHSFDCVCIAAPRSGITSQRNDALSVVTSDIVLFIDDDLALPRNGIAVLLDMFERFPSAVGVQLGVASPHTSRIPHWLRRAYFGWSRVASLERPATRQVITLSGAQTLLNCKWPSALRGQLGDVEIQWLSGCCMAYRTRDIRRAGVRFDERLEHFGGYALAEDCLFSAVLARTLHGRLLWTDRAIAVHMKSRGTRFRNQTIRGAAYAYNATIVWRQLVAPTVLARLAFAWRLLNYCILEVLTGHVPAAVGVFHGLREAAHVTNTPHLPALFEDSGTYDARNEDDSAKDPNNV